MHSLEEEGMKVPDWEGMGLKVEFCKYFFGFNGLAKHCWAGDSCPWAHSVEDKWKKAPTGKVKKTTKKEQHDDRGRSSNDRWQEGSVWQEGEEYNEDVAFKQWPSRAFAAWKDMHRQEAEANAQELNTETTTDRSWQNQILQRQPPHLDVLMEDSGPEAVRSEVNEGSSDSDWAASAAEAVLLFQADHDAAEENRVHEAMAERELAAKRDAQQQAVAVAHHEEAEDDVHRGRRPDTVQEAEHAEANLAALSTGNPRDNPTLEEEAGQVPQSSERAVVTPGCGSSAPKPPPKAPPWHVIPGFGFAAVTEPHPKAPHAKVSRPRYRDVRLPLGSAPASGSEEAAPAPSPASGSEEAAKALEEADPAAAREASQRAHAASVGLPFWKAVDGAAEEHSPAHDDKELESVEEDKELESVEEELESVEEDKELESVEEERPDPFGAPMFQQGQGRMREELSDRDAVYLARAREALRNARRWDFQPTPRGQRGEWDKLLAENRRGKYQWEAEQPAEYWEEMLVLAVENEGPDQVQISEERREQITNLIEQRRRAKNAEHQLAHAEK